MAEMNHKSIEELEKDVKKIETVVLFRGRRHGTTTRWKT